MKKINFPKFNLLLFPFVFLMNMLNGMDLTVVSYATPSIAKDWTITPQILDIVFSEGLLGIAIGRMFLAPIVDYIGNCLLSPN